MKYNRQQRRSLVKASAMHPELLTQIEPSEWPSSMKDKNRMEVWRNRKFLVQVFFERSDVLRVSVNRTEMQSNGRWSDQISWDELQDIKKQIGRGDLFAVEIYPPEKDVVNVANMRHLWITGNDMKIGWVNENN